MGYMTLKIDLQRPQRNTKSMPPATSLQGLMGATSVPLAQTGPLNRPLESSLPLFLAFLCPALYGDQCPQEEPRSGAFLQRPSPWVGVCRPRRHVLSEPVPDTCRRRQRPASRPTSSSWASPRSLPSRCTPVGQGFQRREGCAGQGVGTKGKGRLPQADAKFRAALEPDLLRGCEDPCVRVQDRRDFITGVSGPSRPLCG